jgi:hypothetical protein
MFSAALYARVHFVLYHRTRDRGCSAHPAFPAPSLLEGELVVQLGHILPRDRATASAEAAAACAKAMGPLCGPVDRIRLTQICRGLHTDPSPKHRERSPGAMPAGHRVVNWISRNAWRAAFRRVLFARNRAYPVKLRDQKVISLQGTSPILGESSTGTGSRNVSR